MVFWYTDIIYDKQCSINLLISTEENPKMIEYFNINLFFLVWIERLVEEASTNWSSYKYGRRNVIST